MGASRVLIFLLEVTSGSENLESEGVTLIYLRLAIIWADLPESELRATLLVLKKALWEGYLVWVSSYHATLLWAKKVIGYFVAALALEVRRFWLILGVVSFSEILYSVIFGFSSWLVSWARRSKNFSDPFDCLEDQGSDGCEEILPSYWPF